MSCFRDCRSEPGQRAQRLLAGPTSHSVAVRDGSTMIPLSTERARENETNLRNGSSGPWTRTVRSPASARTDQVLEEGGIGGRGVCESGSGGFHDSPLDDETRGHVFPQRHEQLARQGDEQRLLDAPAISPTSAVSGARASDFKRLTPRVGTTLGAPRGACGVVLAIGDRGAPARSLGRDRGARRSAIALRGREAPPSAG